MDVIAHHLPAVYALLACIFIPLVLFLATRFFVRRQQRLAREAMLRGNQLHRNWLEQSKNAAEQGTRDP